MSIIDFPDHPVVGQVFTDHNNTVWEYHNDRWRRHMPLVVAGNPNFYQLSTHELIVNTPAITTGSIPDRLTNYLAATQPVDGVMFYISQSLIPGADNSGAGVWRYTVDPTQGLDEWIRIIEPGAQGVEKVGTKTDLPNVLNPEDGDLVETLDTHTLYIYVEETVTPPGGGAPVQVQEWREFMSLHPQGDILMSLDYDPTRPKGDRMRWRDDRTQYRAVDTLAERDALLDPEQLVKGALVFVRDQNRQYVYEGTPPQGPPIWWEMMALPDHTALDYAARLEFDPLSPVGSMLEWKDDRETMAMVQTEADLYAIPDEFLLPGKLVYVRDSGTLYEHIADVTTRVNGPADWQAMAGGVTYVGRQSNLPISAVDGQLFVIKFDIGGKEYNRLVAWDPSLPARSVMAPNAVTIDTPAPNNKPIGQSSTATLSLDTGASVINAPADLEVTLDTGTPHTITASVVPGDTAATIAAKIANEFQAAPVAGVTIATVGMGALEFRGDPGTPAQAAVPLTGQRFVSTVRSLAEVVAFAKDPANSDGDYVVTEQAYTEPNGTVVPADMALMLYRGKYYVADAPTPVTSTPSQQTGDLQATPVNTSAELNAWIASAPAVGDVAINTSTQTLSSTLVSVGAGEGVVMTPAGPYGTQSQESIHPIYANGNLIKTQTNPIVGTAMSDTDLVAADQLGPNEGDWFECGYAYAGSGVVPGFQQSAGTGDWFVYTNGAWMSVDGTHKTPGHPFSTGSGTISGYFAYPVPVADYPGTVSAPATPPTTTIPAVTQVDSVTFPSPVATSWKNVGATVIPPGGGWRFINREIWAKDLRSDPDQATDQKAGDLQITRENDHTEIKAWNAASGQWDVIFSRSEIDAAIAALSLFEGTVKEVGGAAIGAVEFSGLPDLPAMTTSGDLSQVSHYWTFIGTPNTQVVAATPQIGVDLDGAVLNPGDWLQIANRGTPTAPDLHWVTVGGDLLAKQRADRLFGLQPWTAGGWEAGSLVVYGGDVFRASQPVTQADPDPTDPAGPWQKLDISGGLKVASDDTGLPATAPAGQVWFVLASQLGHGKPSLLHYDAGSTSWKVLGGAGGVPLGLTGGDELIGIGLPVGSVIDYAGKTAPTGWLVCDGALYDKTKFPDLFGVLGQDHTPNLIDHFVKGGSVAEPYTNHEYSTALPKHHLFVGTTSTTGAHTHTVKTYGDESSRGHIDAGGGRFMQNVSGSSSMDPAGNHQHNVTINGGGDAETAPKHVILMKIIKAFDATLMPRTP